MDRFSIRSLPARVCLAGLLGIAAGYAPAARAAEAVTAIPVGVAAVDITPDYPVRLSGFGFRREESEGVTQRIHAKALAFKRDGQAPVVLITADTLCVPDAITTEVARRLEKEGVTRERLSITASHTHTAPMLTGTAPALFGTDIPADHQKNIERYTKEFTDRLESVALTALRDVQPATLSWGQGQVTFAENRRTKGGPVDHDLPVLAVKHPDGKLRAVYFSYACHCVTLSNNKISGDWCGEAQAQIEARHPGAVALASVGCGADSNPGGGVRGDNVAAVADQGKQIADEVGRLLTGELTALTFSPETRYARVELPFDTARTRAEWDTRAQRNDATGYHARLNTGRLDRGEKLPEGLNYPVQSWLFGEQLAMVFMPGETVVDYSRRLKQELDRTRLWVNGYSNDARCYIPSERVLKEGGYEGGEAMVYYDMPQRFAPGLEQKLIDTVKAQIPPALHARKGTEGTVPVKPAGALKTFRTAPGLTLELVAAEPLVVDPVAIDWDARGRMWVCEMHDYPLGMDGKGKPGGRIKRLEDTDGDGHYDKASVVIDGLPFPTGLMVFGRGVYIGAAPDVLYAEDADDDGRAETVRKVLTGFPAENYQARVNGFTLGLDNYIHAANGLLAGTVRSGEDSSLPPVDIRNRDFRFRHSAGPVQVEPVSGLTQQGRVRDDRGNWYGCDNSRMLLHYGFPEHYMRRNPHIPSPDPVTHLTGRPDGNRVYPASRLLERFNDAHAANRATSACGAGIYRDDLLGTAYAGNAFTCESVHNLVHREIVGGDGVDFTGQRAAEEAESEFLASTDNWFRPVQVRTGPDGALYVVDMYRFLIEHPRWITADRMAQIDERAGADMGRIYRLRPATGALRPVADLTALAPSALAERLDSPNGAERDRVQVELLDRKVPAEERAAAGAVLTNLAGNAALPAVRLQALSALDGLGLAKAEVVKKGLTDADAGVVAHALRLSEHTAGAPVEAVLALVKHPERSVRFQAALTLGESKDPEAGRALAEMLSAAANDPAVRAAVMSSALPHAADMLVQVLENGGRGELLIPLLATIGGGGNQEAIVRAFTAILPPGGAEAEAKTFRLTAALLDALDQREVNPGLLAHEQVRERFQAVQASARRAVMAADTSEEGRLSALAIVGRSGGDAEETAMLCELITSPSEKVRAAARTALLRQAGAETPSLLLGRWPQLSPALRTEGVAFLLNRPEWTMALLEAVKNGTVGAAEVSPATRQQLSLSRHAEVRELAARVLPAAPAGGAREAVVRTRRAALQLKGDAADGAGVFTAVCSSCHQMDGQGVDLGPGLAALWNKDADYWLKNIIDPNAIVEPRFVGYLIHLKDQRMLAGLIKAETASSLQIMMPAGAAETILRSQIDKLEALPVSLMPEGLEQSLTDQQLADLVAFLRTPRDAKKVEGNEPAPVLAGTDGVALLRAAQAEIRGGEITFERQFGNIGYWHGDNDQVSWTVQVPEEGEYDVYVDYACADSSAGNVFTVTGDRAALTAKVTGTGPDWSRYHQHKAGRLQLPAGRQKLTLRGQGKMSGALFDLRAVALAPPGKSPRWAQTGAPVNTPVIPEKATPEEIAKILLDPKTEAGVTDAAVKSRAGLAAEIIAALTRDLQANDSKTEYARIPLIWRFSITCAREGSAEQVRKLFEVSLPNEGEPLRDWQSVVTGGGIVNGISQTGRWPAETINGLLDGHPGLQKRWARTLELAVTMTNDEKVPGGTRYDALRLLGVTPWAKNGALLVNYLGAGINEELQMGAVSGLVDVDAPEAAAALIEAWPGLKPGNRKLAVEGMTRTAARAKTFLAEVDAGRIREADVEASLLKRLREKAAGAK